MAVPLQSWNRGSEIFKGNNQHGSSLKKKRTYIRIFFAGKKGIYQDHSRALAAMAMPRDRLMTVLRKLLLVQAPKVPWHKKGPVNKTYEYNIYIYILL